MVKVTGTAKGRDIQLENGKDITVQDGHLFVYDRRAENGGNTIAAFAPGTWQDAVVETSSS